MGSDSFRSEPVLNSLLWGVEGSVVDLLGIGSTIHRSAMNRLRAVDGVALVEMVFRRIRANYDAAGASARKDKSRENWRWLSLQPQISPRNRSPEVVVERAVAAACVRLGRTDWANQVPVASGLTGGRGGGRMAIDLVRRRGGRHFEFIELKIASNTPLFAAIEIIAYGCLWIIARGDRPARPSDILDADRVDLRVLAPRAYYSPFVLTDLEDALNAGVEALGLRHAVVLSFGFDELDPRIRPDVLPSDEALLEMLDPPSQASG